ncbi:MAG: TIGR00730 family Rossman fold protein [Bacteroidetes bacterium]|nr:TIGR00730 family Rossman fold protein [Bacteroidota bacterium]
MAKRGFKKKRPYEDKAWTQLNASNSWAVFRIMSEFVEAYERMNKIGPCISIFGSARTKEENHYYQMTMEIAQRLVEEGYGVITGGGPGIMEAGNRGAQLAKGKSVGLNITLPHEQEANAFIDVDKLINFYYFFVRKVAFVKYAQGFICLPGGFGTMDEFFEVITLIQTHKIEQIPVVLIGKQYWSGLIEWIEGTLLNTYQNINEGDMNLFKITDDVEEAIDHINEFYAGGPDAHVLRPNF